MLVHHCALHAVFMFVHIVISPFISVRNHVLYDLIAIILTRFLFLPVNLINREHLVPVSWAPVLIKGSCCVNGLSSMLQASKNLLVLPAVGVRCHEHVWMQR